MASVTTPLVPPVDNELLDRLVARIAQRLPDCCVILFGSHAHGSARPSSDVDLLVIADTNQDPLALAGELYQCLRPRRFPLDIVVMTPDEVRARQAGFDSFTREVLATGKVLYGRCA